MKSISLCSYTYNDAALLHGLLADIPSWPRLPDEIVLVDDGSAAPFALSEAEKKLPVRLMRLPGNQGFCSAKHTCISAAKNDIIVAMDCDGRLNGDFLNNAEKMLEDPQTGLVGIADALQESGDMLSSYLNIFEAERRVEGANEAAFVSGGAFAIRRELWEETGGFNGYGRKLAEDYYLSVTLRKLGYKLFLENQSQLRYVRRLSRQSFCRRLWLCYEESWMAGLKPDTPISSYIIRILLMSRRHCSDISGNHPPAWIYYELLSICHICLMFCNSLGSHGVIPISAGPDLLHAIEHGVSCKPILYRLLKADLMRSGSLPLAKALAPAAGNGSPLATICDWQGIAAFLADLEESLALEYLDKKGVQAILADEAAFQTDFSSY